MKTLLALVAAALLAALASVSMVRVGPDEAGVLTRNFGVRGSGIVQQDFAPGWRLGIPVLHTWNMVPSRVRRVEMTKDPRQRSALGTDALLVQSSDGDRVMLDLDIFFRVQPGQAHKLLQDSGIGDGHVSVLRTLAQDRLRSAFGTLHTEQFYDAVARDEKTLEALESLRAVCRSRYLDVVDIKILDVEFERKYEEKIEQKKLADQNVELNKAQARAAAEQSNVNNIRLQTTRNVQLAETHAAAESARIHAEAQKYAARKHADADLYGQQLLAQGNLAKAQAEAKVKQAKADALKDSAGANMVALEAVKNLRIDSLVFPTTTSDWFDVHAMAVRLGARP